MEKEKSVERTVNFDYLESFAKKNNLTMSSISEGLGRDKSYLSYRKMYNQKLKDAQINILCVMYGMDKKELTSIKNETAIKNSSKENDFLLGKIIELSERVSILENLTTKRKEPILTSQEDIVLLLQQMTKYGQCEEKIFKEKAKSYGYGNRLCDYAIDFLGCKKDITKGKVWLKK